MSFSFYVPSPTLPRLGEVLEALPFADVRCCEEARSEEEELFDRAAHWPDRHLHFYRDGLSTCAVEVYWEDGAFQVRVMAFAAPEEYELALEFAEFFARRSGTTVRPEDGDAMTVEELRRKYDPDWIAGQVASLFSMLPTIVRDSEGSCQVPGPVRLFHVGRRLLGELEAAGPPEELRERLLAKMREVQYVDPEEYFCASAMEVRPQGSDKTFSVAAFGPEVRYLFPSVDYLAVIESGKGVFFIPYEALPEVAPGRWSWLDEHQTLVEPFEPDEWPALLERARRHEVEPEPKRAPRGRYPEDDE